jgi:hypothetical protein
MGNNVTRRTAAPRPASRRVASHRNATIINPSKEPQMAMQLEMSEETTRLLEFLANRPPEFTFDEASNITGVNDMARLRGYIYTCLRRLKKERIWYVNIRGIGYRRIPEPEKNQVQDKKLGKVTKGVRRVNKDQNTISVSLLSREAKLEFTFNSARIGRMIDATSRKVARELKREIGNAQLPRELKRQIGNGKLPLRK